MKEQNWIELKYAAKQLGLSFDTVERFIELGALRSKNGENETVLINKTDFEQTFGIVQMAAPKEEAVLTSGCSLKIEEEEKIQSVTAEQPEEDTEEVENFEEAVIETKKVHTKKDLPKKIIPTLSEGTILATSNPEAISLRKIIDLQEQVIKLRESQITEVQEDRNWLRERVSKLEDLRDRDQALIMSASQNVSKLVQQIEVKKSVVRTALEWFGVGEKPLS